MTDQENYHRIQESRTFLLCDDSAHEYITGRIFRHKNEVIADIWNLAIGGYLDTGRGTGVMRET